MGILSWTASTVLGVYAGYILGGREVDPLIQQQEALMHRYLAQAAGESDPMEKVDILIKALPEMQWGRHPESQIVPSPLLCAQVYLAAADAYSQIEKQDKVIEMSRKGLHFSHDDASVTIRLYLHLGQTLYRFQQNAEASQVAYALGEFYRPLAEGLPQELRERVTEFLAQPGPAGIDLAPIPGPGWGRSFLQSLFPKHKSMLRATFKILEVREMLGQRGHRFYEAALSRDLDDMRENLETLHELEDLLGWDLRVRDIGVQEEAIRVLRDGCLWENLHDSTETKVDLYAMLCFFKRELDVLEYSRALEEAVNFCRTTASPALQIARLHSKLSSLLIKSADTDDYEKARNCAQAGLAENEHHQNFKLKARLCVRLAVAQNRLENYHGALAAARQGSKFLIQSQFDLRLKTRLLTQEAYACNRLGLYQEALDTATTAFNAAREELPQLVDWTEMPLATPELCRLYNVHESRSQCYQMEKMVVLTAAKLQLEGGVQVPIKVDQAFLLMQVAQAQLEWRIARNHLLASQLPPIESDEFSSSERQAEPAVGGQTNGSLKRSRDSGSSSTNKRRKEG